MTRTLLAALATAAATVSAQGTSPATGCTALTAPVVANATVVAMQAMPMTAVPVNMANGTVMMLSFCDVNVTLTHGNAGDRVRIETWLPLTQADWNGRFQATGGSGFAAGLFAAALGPAVADGYAASSTDAGVGTTGSFPVLANTTAALMTQLLTNFGSLSVHEMAVVGKALVQQLYDQPATKSYFTGCSTGGRQGMMEAQQYPSDFDGILAASPAINWDRLLAAMLWPFSVLQQQFPPGGTGEVVPQCVLDAFQGGVLSACDALDGVTDGVIAQPGLCTFDPTTLVGRGIACSNNGNNSASSITITAAHAAVFSKILAGPASPTGQQLWYGLLPGATPDLLASTTQNGTAPFSLAATWLNNFVLGLETVNNSNTFSLKNAQTVKVKARSTDTTALANVQAFTNVFQQSQQMFDVQLGTDNPDLRAFEAAGGKMLSWHGLADQLVFPNGTFDYVQRTMDLLDAAAVDGFFRVFSAPGVQHCGGGPGAMPTDPLAALVSWVENGTAPDTLPAMRMATMAGVNATATGNSTTASVITRNLCRYPQMMVYSGSGDASLAASWMCMPGPNQQVISQTTASETTPVLAETSGASGGLVSRAGGLSLAAMSALLAVFLL
ncbi:hypothetical protein SCUCBS95973_000674 [Sporothrix curviconia]|uniref:Carboxylic ester hydrolase n=1 Tax=Sporothrix curviconia TaxID=1260050 RepID=A0ABP0AS77_9PEZI